MAGISDLPEYPRRVAGYLTEYEGYDEGEAAAVAINHMRRVAGDADFDLMAEPDDNPRIQNVARSSLRQWDS